MFGNDHVSDPAIILDSAMFEIATLPPVTIPFFESDWKYRSESPCIPLSLIVYLTGRFVLISYLFVRVLYSALTYMGRKPESSVNVRRNTGKYTLNPRVPSLEDSTTPSSRAAVLVKYSNYCETPQLPFRDATGAISPSRDPREQRRSNANSRYDSEVEVGRRREPDPEIHPVSRERSNIVVRNDGNFSVTLYNSPRCRAPLQIGQQAVFTTSPKIEPQTEFSPGVRKKSNPSVKKEHGNQNATPKSFSAQSYPSFSRQKIYLPSQNPDDKLQQYVRENRSHRRSTAELSHQVEDEAQDMVRGPTQYYRYSHLLVFPVQSMFHKSEPDSDTLRKNSASCLRGDEDSAKPRITFNNNSSEPDLSTMMSERPLVSTGVSKSVEVLISSSSESLISSELQNMSATSRIYPMNNRTRREKAKRPSDFNPYDPYRPARRKPPPRQPQKSRTRSISSLEWKFLRTFDAKAFRPEMKAWRSGIDVSSSVSYYANNERILAHGSGENAFSAEVCFLRDDKSSTLTVHLLQLISPIHSTAAGTRVHVQVTLLPRRDRVKSRAHSTQQQHWHESFTFHRIRTVELNHLAVNFSIYTQTLVGKSRLLAHEIVKLHTVNLRDHLPMWIHLKTDLAKEETVERSYHAGFAGHIKNVRVEESGLGARLQVGLRYSQSSGRLTVEIITASNIWFYRWPSSEEVFVTVNLYSGGGEVIDTSRTSSRRRSVAPLFRESCLFTVPLYQLSEVTVEVCLLLKKYMSRDSVIGYLHFSDTTKQLSVKRHWQEMTRSMGSNIRRWHRLISENV